MTDLIKDFESNSVKFSDFDLASNILAAIEEIGYIKPTEIQANAIPHVLEGRDVIGLAQTGTGKTAAFGLPTLSSITSAKRIQSLVICPTRELAKQIEVEYKKFLSKYDSIKTVCVYGGEERFKQKGTIKRVQPQIIIGTPGRIIDFINDNVIDISGVSSVILDEADEMLNMGFVDDMNEILSKTPATRQTLLFSATMPSEIAKITRNYQKNPIEVKIKKKTETSANIKQTYYAVLEREKKDLLVRLLDYDRPNSGIIFCNTKSQVDSLALLLKKNGIVAEGLHGDLKQQQRDRVMDGFKDKHINLLIATDVAARGIDVNDVEVVINFDLPQDNESYVHRIGRTGRAGKSGVSISFVSRSESRRLRDIERHTKSQMELLKPPKARDIKRNAYLKFIEQIKDSVNSEHELTERFIAKLAETGLSADDIILGFSNYYLNLTNKDYNDLTDISGKVGNNTNNSGRNSNNSDSERKTGKRRDEARISINVKKGPNVTPRTIVEFLTKNNNIPKNAFGDIDINTRCTYVNVKRSYLNSLLKSKDGARFKKTDITIRVER